MSGQSTMSALSISGVNMRPMAFAPASAAAMPSSTFVIPQILTTVLMSDHHHATIEAKQQPTDSTTFVAYNLLPLTQGNEKFQIHGKIFMLIYLSVK